MMLKKKFMMKTAIVLLCMGTLIGCGNSAIEQNSTITPNESLSQSANTMTPTIVTEHKQEITEETTEFVLSYPAHMEQFGYTESLILEKEPETIVTLSTYPVLTLFAMNVELAAAPSTKVITYPEDFSGILLPSTMSDNFDLEVVVAQNPDLVIMPVTSA